MTYVLIWPDWLVFNAIAYAFAPWLVSKAAPAFGLTDNGTATGIEPRLSGWLSVFGQDDNSLWGDAGWQRENDYKSPEAMIRWLRKNPGYTFEIRVIGAAIRPLDKVRFLGNPWIKDGDEAVAGYCFTMVGWYWHLIYIVPIGFGRCLHHEFGWKLQTYAQDHRRTVTQPRAQYVFSPRFSRFSKG